MMKNRLLCFLLVLGGLMHPAAAGEPPGPVQLRCEYRENPLGVDLPQPRLAWISASTRRGEIQTAWQVLVASSPDLLAKDQGNLWDSGQVKSAQSIQINYAGQPLASSRQVFWKVRTWDRENQPSPWSEPATWTMGVLSQPDWQAKWITAPETKIPPSLLLRREFAVKAGLHQAMANISGLGHYELFLNGKKVGANLLAPGWTNYAKTILYDSQEVTALLKPGATNAVGVVLGNGMYNVIGGRYTKFKGSFGPQKLIAQLRLEYLDGSVETIGTDETWKQHAGPITFSCIYGGEDYDARLEQMGWSETGFADTGWEPAAVTEGPGGELHGISCAAPPIRAFDILQPIGQKKLNPRVTVYDLGQNTALMPRITVKGPAGSSVKITPSELIRENGDIEDTMCRGNNWWSYTLKGDGGETWFPQFYYRGTRYLKVETQPAPGSETLPVVESIAGAVVHTSSAPAGTFSCSNDLFNRTHTLVRWAQCSNLVSVLTDCPTREKLGWLEQYHLNGPSLRYEWDLAALFTKGMRDMQDSQTASGFVPSIAPEFTKFGGDGDKNPFRNSPEWGSAFILCAWQQLAFDGDLELARRHYPAMQHYAAYLDSRAQDHLLDFGLGDWYDIGPKKPGLAQLTPKALTATAIYFEDITALSNLARFLGKTDDAQRYTAQAEEIRSAFNRKFLDPQTMNYATGSQCANAMPLVLNLVAEADRPAVLANLVEDVEKKGLTAGDVGYRYLLRALADGGRSEVIYAMNNQSEKPGYGLQLARGATSLTEAWDALRGSSQNHFMLGQINEWFYHDLAGIQPDPTAPGFKKIIINPAITGDLQWVKASHTSPYGPVSSEWRHSGSRVTLIVTIPPNTTATVHVPTQSAASVTEGGQPVTPASPFVKFLRQEKYAAVFEIASGTWQFEASF